MSMVGVVLNVFLSILALYMLIGAISVHFDSQGDKSNGWAWRCAVWIIILLGKMWL